MIETDWKFYWARYKGRPVMGRARRPGNGCVEIKIGGKGFQVGEVVSEDDSENAGRRDAQG